MGRMNRRDLLRMLGTGCLIGSLAQDSNAQASKKSQTLLTPLEKPHIVASNSLMQEATQTVALSDNHDQVYFWRDAQTLLFLSHVPGEKVFRVVLVDAATGQKTLPQAFNAKNRTLLEGRQMIVMCDAPAFVSRCFRKTDFPFPH